MFLVVLLIVLALALFYKYVSYKQSHWTRLRVTSPRPKFFFGSYWENWMRRKNQIDIFDELYRKYKNTDRVIGIYQVMTPQLLIVDPNLVKDVAVKFFSNFHDTSFGEFVNPENDPLLARNPFFLSGQEWKDKRAEITPAFSPARIKTMYPLVEDICGRIKKYLTAKQGEAIDGRDLCTRFTCDVVSNCIFGADAESFVHENPKIRDMARGIFSTSVVAQLKFLLMLVIPKIGRFLKFSIVSRESSEFFSDLMAQAVEQRQRGGISRQDYLDFLLKMQEKKKVSDLELAANAITFFIDGLETSAVAISCALYEIAKNKDVQTRLRQELEGVSGYDQLADHEYLNMVFHEALRLHPPAGFSIRECTTPIEIEVLGKEKKLQFKKGDAVMIPVYSIHHDEKVYEEPLKFKPERFADGGLKQYQDDGLFLSFGLGPRICLGQRFARAQSKACIATIVKNFEIEVDSKTKEPLELDPIEFLTIYTGGIWLKFKKISK